MLLRPPLDINAQPDVLSETQKARLLLFAITGLTRHLPLTPCFRFYGTVLRHTGRTMNVYAWKYSNRSAIIYNGAGNVKNFLLCFPCWRSLTSADEMDQNESGKRSECTWIASERLPIRFARNIRTLCVWAPVADGYVSSVTSRNPAASLIRPILRWRVANLKHYYGERTITCTAYILFF